MPRPNKRLATFGKAWRLRHPKPYKMAVWWVPAIANLSAPTAAELNAGIKLTPSTFDGPLGVE